MSTKAFPSPDLFLAKRAARGDAEAWEEVIGRYGERIFNLALRFAPSPAEAEDLTQEIFLKLYNQLDRYHGKVPLMAWILRLSRNLCIDHYRHNRTRLRSETVSEEVLEMLPGTDDPQRDSVREENRRLVHSVLAEMPETQAAMVVLRDLQGFTYEELSAFFEVPVGTIKSRLNRARRTLVRHLERRLDLPPDSSLAAPGGAPC